MEHRLNIREDGSEVVTYHYDGYYAHVSKGLLSAFRNYTVDLHWHMELEFALLLSGHMNYHVNSEVVSLRPGQGVVINSRQLHGNFSADQGECAYLVVVLHPMLLCATPELESQFITPLLQGPPCLLLHPEVPWENRILCLLREIYDHKHDPTAPLFIQSRFYEMTELLQRNLPEAGHAKEPADSKLSLVKELLTYIQHHYTEPLTLEDVARRGNISKSGCLALFRQYVKDTPIHYLISCRLKAGAELLRESDLPVVEIAFQVGFSNASYFTERFRRMYGVTPIEYRKKHPQEQTFAISR